MLGRIWLLDWLAPPASMALRLKDAVCTFALSRPTITMSAWAVGVAFRSYAIMYVPSARGELQLAACSSSKAVATTCAAYVTVPFHRMRAV
jgi:hypothetical protein